jgi:hypothetical protein
VSASRSPPVPQGRRARSHWRVARHGAFRHLTLLRAVESFFFHVGRARAIPNLADATAGGGRDEASVASDAELSVSAQPPPDAAPLQPQPLARASSAEDEAARE